MGLTRRKAMTLGCGGVIGHALVGPARAAGCLDLAGLSGDLRFVRDGTLAGVARRLENRAAVIDYTTLGGARVERREVTAGVFETAIEENASDPALATATPTKLTRSFSPAPEELWKTGLWLGQMSELGLWVKRDARGQDDFKRILLQWSASYRLLEAEDVKIAGCSYPVIPIEAEFSTSSMMGGLSLWQRWLWFADLQVALEVGRGDENLALTLLEPA